LFAANAYSSYVPYLEINFLLVVVKEYWDYSTVHCIPTQPNAVESRLSRSHY